MTTFYRSCDVRDGIAQHCSIIEDMPCYWRKTDHGFEFYREDGVVLWSGGYNVSHHYNKYLGDRPSFNDDPRWWQAEPQETVQAGRVLNKHYDGR
jgi:hypothetical protein